MTNINRFFLLYRKPAWAFVWSVTVSVVAAAILGGTVAQFTGASDVTSASIVGISVLALCHAIPRRRLKND